MTEGPLFMGEDEVVALFTGLTPPRLHQWVRLGWVRPERHEGLARYHEADIARVRLIHTLAEDLELEEDTLVLILTLIDQNHELRHHMRAFAAVMDEQPPGIRERLVNTYRRYAGD